LEKAKNHGKYCGTCDGSPRENNTRRHTCHFFSVEEKKIIGYKCKRLLDLGRVEFLTKHGFEANLVGYVEESVTPENVLLVATKNNQDVQ